MIKSTAGGKIEDTGPLTRKRMETVDVEITDGALDFMDRAHESGKPFFLWWNSTRMHVWTHLRAESQNVTGIGIYPDGMVEHDGMIGQILAKIDALGITANTIVMYSTDNGAEVMSWPDGGTTPFRGEKNTNWEGGYRVPTVIRWPGVIEPGTIYNDIFSHEDMLPTFLAAAGEPDIKEKLLKGYSAMGRNYKVHLDGYNLLPYLKGEVDESPRKEFLYWTDGGDLACLRYNQWKLVFMEQQAHSVWVWTYPFVPLRLPKLFTLRGDPFELADHEGIGYEAWWFDHLFLMGPAQYYVGQWLQSFKEFPPRQKPGSFSLDQVMAKLTEPSSD